MNQEEYELKLKEWAKNHNVSGEHLSFKQSCHSVEEASRAANAKTTDFVKNICMIDKEGRLIVAIVKGEDRASTTNVGKTLGIERPRTATPDEILSLTGYPCGGTPSFGYDAKVIVDLRVMDNEIVYTGGGSENSLFKIKPQDLLRANSGIVANIRK
jgi:Cys-tRNA(Pro)/Cys-tRNA(Cys) deacylase